MKSALVVGCAACVWDDVAAAQDMHLFDAVYCVKLAGVHWPGPFKVWATLHPEFMLDYSKQRAANNFPMGGYEIVAPLAGEVSRDHSKHPVDRRVSYRFKGMNASASSGIYGAKVALDDGYDRIVMAGIPMDTSNHFTRGKPWGHLDSFTDGFSKSVPFLRGKVKSMSGMTKDVLGGPTPGWLMGDPSAA